MVLLSLSGSYYAQFLIVDGDNNFSLLILYCSQLPSTAERKPPSKSTNHPGLGQSWLSAIFSSHRSIGSLHTRHLMADIIHG